MPRETPSAAVECSRTIRGFVGYRRVFHLRRFLAARQIQRMGRGLVTRKRVVKLLSSFGRSGSVGRKPAASAAAPA